MENIMIFSKEFDGKIKIFKLVLVAAVICMIASIFLPYATATEENKEYILKHKNEKALDGLDYTYEELINVSMIEFVNINDIVTDDGIIYKIILACIGGFAVITGVWAFFGKGIRTIIFAVLSYGMFWFQSGDFESRKVVPSDSYKWGIAYYLFIIVTIVVIATAIAMKVFVVKKKSNIAQGQM